MKSTLRLFGPLALAAVVASMANAQVQSYTYSEGYALAYLRVNSDFSVSSTGTYQSSGYYSVGNEDYANQLLTNGSSYILQAGFSSTLGDYGRQSTYLDSDFIIEVTNNSNYNATFVANVDTRAGGSSYFYGPNNDAFEESESHVYDTEYFNSGHTDGIDQYAEESTYADDLTGLGAGYLAATFNNGSTYLWQSNNPFGSYASVIAAYGQVFDYVTLAPGQTDYIHVSTIFARSDLTKPVPGPAAVAPFALGLLGAIRRRKVARVLDS
jgi:MYXO-CTERM domain-containing protein